ncbi:hypothetical protein M0802_011138 [Mischocyttarus mexicanus]|nr:hypothetical protein M0802_013668 [Mischocyttarus mexicanus]KAI4489383.1 hypothetical protein M0802_011138 [Mischocyttarus mexicanus]
MDCTKKEQHNEQPNIDSHERVQIPNSLSFVRALKVLEEPGTEQSPQGMIDRNTLCVALSKLDSTRTDWTLAMRIIFFFFFFFFFFLLFDIKQPKQPIERDLSRFLRTYVGTPKALQIINSETSK